MHKICRRRVSACGYFIFIPDYIILEVRYIEQF